MKFSTPKIVIPSLSFRLEVIIGIVLLYIIILCLVFRSCLQVSFEGYEGKGHGDDGMSDVDGGVDDSGMGLVESAGYIKTIKSKPKYLNGDDSHDGDDIHDGDDSPEYTKRGNVHDSDKYISKSSDDDNVEKRIQYYESIMPPGYVLTPEFRAFIRGDFEKAIEINPGLEEMCGKNGQNHHACMKFVDTKGNVRYIFPAPKQYRFQQQGEGTSLKE